MGVPKLRHTWAVLVSWNLSVVSNSRSRRKMMIFPPSIASLSTTRTLRGLGHVLISQAVVATFSLWSRLLVCSGCHLPRIGPSTLEQTCNTTHVFCFASLPILGIDPFFQEVNSTPTRTGFLVLSMINQMVLQRSLSETKERMGGLWERNKGKECYLMTPTAFANTTVSTKIPKSFTTLQNTRNSSLHSNHTSLCLSIYFPAIYLLESQGIICFTWIPSR